MVMSLYEASDLVWNGGLVTLWECEVGNVARINVAEAMEEGFLHLEQQSLIRCQLSQQT